MSTTSGNSEIPSELINCVELTLLDEINTIVLDSITNEEDVESNEFLDKLTNHVDKHVEKLENNQLASRELASGLINIWMTAAKRSAKIKSLVNSLKISGVEEERSGKFGELWSEKCTSVIQAMKHYTRSLNPNHVVSIDTVLKRNSTLVDGKRVIQSNLVQLDMKKADNSVISLDLARDQLSDLFESIDKIQNELESLLKP